MKTHQQKKQEITNQIISSFKSQFPGEEPQSDFETIWPLSAWDLLHTENKTFNIHLKLSTGKILSITEEKI